MKIIELLLRKTCSADTKENYMSSGAGPNPKILAGVVGVLALGLIAIPLAFPNATTPEAFQSSDTGALVSGDLLEEEVSIITPATPEIDGELQTENPNNDNSDVTGSAAESTLFAALASYESQLALQGGVFGSFISANSQEMMISILPNGNFRAVTTDPNAPEWLYVDPVLYARLGQSELQAQKTALEAIGKPDAAWTDAAMNSERQGIYLSAASMSNAVSDLVPLMKKIMVSEGPNRTKVIQGFIDLTGDLGLNAEAYNLKPVDPEDTSRALQQASVVFTIDSSGVLQGYIVQPPGSAQPVSLLLTKFDAPNIKRPSPARVITLEDLAPILEESEENSTP